MLPKYLSNICPTPTAYSRHSLFLACMMVTVSYYCPVSSFILFSYIPYTAVEVIFLKPKLDHVTYWSHWITPKEYKTKTNTLWHAYKAPNDLNLFLCHTAQPSSLWFPVSHTSTLCSHFLNGNPYLSSKPKSKVIIFWLPAPLPTWLIIPTIIISHKPLFQ